MDSRRVLIVANRTASHARARAHVQRMAQMSGRRPSHCSIPDAPRSEHTD